MRPQNRFNTIIDALANGCSTTAQVAKLLGLDVSNVSATLNKLVLAGYVARDPNMVKTGKCRPVVVWRLLKMPEPCEVVRYLEAPDLPPPASLTAALLGDPRPGRSALDKRHV